MDFKTATNCFTYSSVCVYSIYPIDELSFVHLFANKAIKLHEKIGFDMVVSEHSGVETLLAGYYLKKNYPNVKYLPILWDPILGKKICTLSSSKVCT